MMTEEHLAAFVGPNAGYYLHHWRQLQSGKRLSFNTAAFFLGILWFIYRRMYLWTGLLLLAILALTLLEELLVQQVYPGYNVDSPGFSIVSGLLIASLLAGLGNWLYLTYAERRIQQVLRRGLPEDETLAVLRKQGGTSLTFFIVVAAVVAVLVTVAKLDPAAFSR